MSYLLNYKKWRAVHEAAIFEGAKDPMRAPRSFSLADGFTPVATAFNGSQVVYDLVANNIPGFTGIINQLTDIISDNGDSIIRCGSGNYSRPGTGLGGTAIEGIKDGDVSKFLTAMLEGAMGQFTQKEAEKVVPANVSLADAGYMVKFTPDPSSGAPATIGYVNSGKLKGVSEEASEDYSILIGYVNYYNIMAKAYGQPQYSGTEANFTNGYFDFKNATAGGGADDPLILFIPTVQKVGSIARSENAVTKVVAGISADKTQADVGFEVGLATLTAAGKTQVAELAKTILDKFKGQTVTGFNLTSSASPEYGAIKNVAGWEKSYDAITGTTDPGVGTTDAAKNKKLAYDRGVSFMTELNSQLATQGHPGFKDYTITWKISSTGGPNNNGRFVDLNLATNEQKPKIEVTGTKVSGTATAATAVGGAESMSCNVQYFKVKRPVKE